MESPKDVIPTGQSYLRSVGFGVAVLILLAGAVTSGFFYMRNQEATLSQMRELVVKDVVSMGTRVKSHLRIYKAGLTAVREIHARGERTTPAGFRQVIEATMPGLQAQASIAILRPASTSGGKGTWTVELAHGSPAFGLTRGKDLAATATGKALAAMLAASPDDAPLEWAGRLPVGEDNHIPAAIFITPCQPDVKSGRHELLVGIFAFEELIGDALDASTTLSYDVLAYAESIPGQQQLLFFDPASYRDVKTITNFQETSNSSSQTCKFTVGDANVFLVFTPTNEWMRRNHSPLPMVVFLLGMGMTATLATLYIAKARRASAIEALVHERTAELSLANLELDQSRGTLASLLEACPDAINGKDAHGRWTFANRAFLELAGIHEHFPYKGLKDADILQRAAPTNPRFLEARGQLDHELLASGQPVRREMTIDAPDTTRRYLDIHMLPVRGSDGSTAGLVAVHNDITELRRRIIALQRSRERVKLLVENTATAIVEWDESFRVIHWNPAAARMFGYDWDDVRQKPVDFFASPDDTANATLSLASCLKERETTIPQIFRHRTKRGQPLICEWQNTPLVGEDGHPLGVTSFIYDVTERTKAESALRKRDGILRGLAGSAAGFLNADSWEPEACELLRHLVDSLALSRVHLVHVASTIDGPAPSTVFEWLNPYGDTAALATPDGPDPHQKLCVDGLCKSLLESGQMLGPVASLPPEWAATLASQGTRSVLLLPLRIKGEHWGFLRFDDCQSEREWSAGEVDALRVVAAVLAGAIARQTMTKDRLQIEKRLLLSQKRESLGLLAGGVARDFDNIINHILGSASLGRTLAETESTIDSCLASIEDHGLRAAALCRQMLAYSGHTEAHSGLASPNLIVLDVLSAIDPACQRRIHIRKDLANGIPVVEVDMDQMRQAITGIVQNAIEAIGNHQPGMLEIITRPARDGAEITIRDSGGGMDTAVRDRIFDPFFSTKMSGRGLGLTLSQSIIEAHGGSIQIDSIPAKGTTVRITLPARLPRPEPQSPSPEMTKSTASGHVLIVHGGRPSGHATALAFAQLGFDTDECASVDQALQLFLSYPGKFRLVAVEPAARGAEAPTLQRLRLAAQDCPVILLTDKEHCPSGLRHFAEEGLAVLLPGELSATGLRHAVTTALGA